MTRKGFHWFLEYLTQRVRRRDFLEFASSKSHQISWPWPFPLVEHEDVCRRCTPPKTNTIFIRRYRYISKRLFFHCHVSSWGVFYGVNGFRPKIQLEHVGTFGSGDSLGEDLIFSLGSVTEGVVAKIIVPLCVGQCSQVVFFKRFIPQTMTFIYIGFLKTHSDWMVVVNEMS